MQADFPYQIVTFLDDEPKQKEPVYYGAHGWYPQLALKRRFKLNHVSEEYFIAKLKEFLSNISELTVFTGEPVKPEHMPVHVISVKNQEELKSFHNKLLDYFANEIISKYPEREGQNYYPHITAEYNGKHVISTDKYTDRAFNTKNIWLLKDVDDDNSQAYIKIH